MTELARIEDYQHPSSLHEQMDYARAVSVASMLPDSYRGKPADIMLAVGLGQSMGLSPAESLYRIAVIKGKPTASAELVAANVRKAGHRLRVNIEPGKATATIVRSDDPEFEFTVVRDAAWAKQMGLSDQPNYRKQGDTMLSWRAITACARLACPEALYGVQYTADEMGDTDTPRSGGLSAALHVEQIHPEPSGADPDVASVAPDLGRSVEPVSAPESPLLNTSSKLAKRMFALFGEVGLTGRDERLAYVNDVIQPRMVDTSAEMTDADAVATCDALQAEVDALNTGADS